MGSFSPKELEAQKVRESEYGARFGFIPNEETQDEYMRKGEQLMKGLTDVKITVWPEVRKGCMGLVDRLSPKRRNKIDFYDLRRFTSVYDDSGDNTGSIYIRVHENQPYTKDLRAALFDFRNTDPDGFDTLVRHMYCTNAYTGARRALKYVVQEQGNFEECLEILTMSEKEIAAKELNIEDL